MGRLNDEYTAAASGQEGDKPQDDTVQGLRELLGQFYEDSIDAYHAFMGTYTDAVSDETAPDRLIDKYCALLRTTLEGVRPEKQDEEMETNEGFHIPHPDRQEIRGWNKALDAYDEAIQEVLKP